MIAGIQCQLLINLITHHPVVEGLFEIPNLHVFPLVV